MSEKFLTNMPETRVLTAFCGGGGAKMPVISGL